MNITPCLMVKNEEYWIHYVLRDLLKVFPEVIVLDTGSTDNTLNIINSFGDRIRLVSEYWDDANSIGYGRNVLRDLCNTYWMLLVDGDEVYPECSLRQLVHQVEGFDDEVQVGMTLGRNVAWIDNKWMEREGFNADRLFNPEVVWNKTDYPFEGHGLYDRLAAGKVRYFDDKVYFWHTRHLQRSSKDELTYFRRQKQDYFGDGSQFIKPLTTDWYGDPTYGNPYITGL